MTKMCMAVNKVNHEEIKHRCTKIQAFTSTRPHERTLLWCTRLSIDLTVASETQKDISWSIFIATREKENIKKKGLEVCIKDSKMRECI
jgi:hypothetical protein